METLNALDGLAEAMAAFARQLEVAGRALAQSFGRMMEAVMTAAGTFMQGLKTPVGLERSAMMLGKLGIGVLSTKRAATKTGWLMQVTVKAVSTKMEPGLVIQVRPLFPELPHER